MLSSPLRCQFGFSQELSFRTNAEAQRFPAPENCCRRDSETDNAGTASMVSGVRLSVGLSIRSANRRLNGQFRTWPKFAIKDKPTFKFSNLFYELSHVLQQQPIIACLGPHWQTLPHWEIQRLIDSFKKLIFCLLSVSPSDTTMLEVHILINFPYFFQAIHLRLNSFNINLLCDLQVDLI